MRRASTLALAALAATGLLTLADWAEVQIDPIDVARAGPLLEDAVTLMLEVGWN